MASPRRADRQRDQLRALLGFVTAMLGVIPLLVGLTWLSTRPDQLVRSVFFMANGLVLVLGGLCPTLRTQFLGTLRGGVVFALASVAWLGFSDHFIASPMSPPATATPIPIVVPTLQPLSAPAGDCHPSYPDFCIPAPPPALDCESPTLVARTNVTVLPPDPHGLDRDGNGVGCES